MTDFISCQKIGVQLAKRSNGLLYVIWPKSWELAKQKNIASHGFFKDSQGVGNGSKMIFGKYRGKKVLLVSMLVS